MLKNLELWQQSDLQNSITTYPLRGGGFGACRVRAQLVGPAIRIGFPASGSTILEALRGVDSDVTAELEAPTQPRIPIPARDDKAPETRPTGVESWAPRHSMVEALRDCDSATQRAARISGKGAANG
jgi:hypothetical protein